MNKDPVYIDSDIIVNEGIEIIRDSKRENIRKWKTNFKTHGTLKKLDSKYKLISSIIGRYEAIRNIAKKTSIPLDIARKVYYKIIEKYNILEVSFENKKLKKFFTWEFIETLLENDVDFKDGLHCRFAQKLKIELITKNRNHLKRMKKLWDYVYLPEEKI